MTLYVSWRDKLVEDYTAAVQKPVCAECGVHSGAPCIDATGVVHEPRKKQAIVEGYWDPTKIQLPTEETIWDGLRIREHTMAPRTGQ